MILIFPDFDFRNIVNTGPYEDGTNVNNSTLQRTQCESIETTVRTRRLLWAGALLRMGDHRLPKRVMSGELENAGKRGPGGKEKEWTDCVADDLRLFGVTGDWKTAALDPGAWYNTVQEGGCRFMAAWVREEENASNQRQKKRDADRRTRLSCTWCDCSKLKTFSNRVDWANPRTP